MQADTGAVAKSYILIYRHRETEKKRDTENRETQRDTDKL